MDPLAAPQGPNQCRRLEFLRDALTFGRRFWMLCEAGHPEDGR
jgi:hypothetical protein